MTPESIFNGLLFAASVGLVTMMFSIVGFICWIYLSQRLSPTKEEVFGDKKSYAKFEFTPNGYRFYIDMKDPEVQAKIYEQAVKHLPKDKKNG